jgi:hypothetical protein
MNIYDKIFGGLRPRRKSKWWHGYPPIPVRKSGEADSSDAEGFSTRLPKPPDTTFDFDEQPLHPRDAANGGDNGDDTHAPLFSPGPKHISELANLIAEASGGLSRQQALDYLLYSAGGRKIAVRTRHAKRASEKEATMQSQSELMSDVVKHYGIVPFCKSVAAGDIAVSEHELTKLIGEDAQRRGTTFAALFASQTPEGVTLRKAINAAKEAQWVKQGIGPLMPILPTWTHPKDVNNPKDALDQLNEMAEKMRRTTDGSTLSAAQAFSRVYSDPANAALVARERAEARAKLPTVGGRAVGE